MERELAETVRTTAKQAEKIGVLGDGLQQPMGSLFEGVFEDMPWHLREQQEQMLREARAAGIGP
jgi:2-oxoisovalerate dehydrogenase E1 component alpha subunit